VSESIVFTGGGTGGHVFPGLAVAEELKSLWQGRIIWIGSNKGIERQLLKAAGIPFFGIPAGKLRRYFSIKNIMDIFRVIGGLAASLHILAREKPLLLFSKGGYVSVPPVIAARLLGIRVITHESDAQPGLATRINSRFAEKILVSFSESAGYFSDKMRKRVVQVGNPVRRELFFGKKKYGRRLVGCPENKKVLLVLGGSQGSAQINYLIRHNLDRLAKACFVVHQAGRVDFRQHAQPNYFTAPFFDDELKHLLAAADLVVCRAGANTLWELASLGKPAVLIPLPRSASRGDQVLNAEIFARNGAAVVLPENDTSGTRLLEIILDLLDNKKKLKQMENRARSLGFPGSAAKIAELILTHSGLRPQWT